MFFFNGDVDVVLFCCMNVFFFFACTVAGYCFFVVLLMIWCFVSCLLIRFLVCPLFSICLLAIFCFLLDWLIDRSTDRLIDCWLVVWLVSFGFVLWFYLVWCLAHMLGFQWALWPLRVSVGPSWFCGAGFSDGKVQKLDANSTWIAWRWLQNTLSGTVGKTHRKRLVRETVWPFEGWGTWSSPLAPIYV